EEVDGASSASRFGVAGAGVAPAAEGEMHLGADGGGVDVDDAGCKLPLGPGGDVHVATVDRGREPEGDIVHDSDRFVEGRTAQDAYHRPEDLLPGDPHLRRNPGENRGSNVETVVKLAFHVPVAPGQKRGPFLPADADVAQDLFPLGFIDQRTNLGCGIQAVAEL